MVLNAEYFHENTTNTKKHDGNSKATHNIPRRQAQYAAASAGEADVMLPVSTLVDTAFGGGPRPSGAPGMRGAQAIGIASAGGDVAS